MGKLNKQIVLSVGMAVSFSSIGQVTMSKGIYDMKPKNSFRGGSRGKGGKIKYARR